MLKLISCFSQSLKDLSDLPNPLKRTTTKTDASSSTQYSVKSPYSYTSYTSGTCYRLNRFERPKRFMPSREDITYFGAGPAGLPTSVLETAAEALVDYNNTGLGLAEHSHRSELAANVLNETKADLKAFLNIPDDYEILFMQGGGSGQFSATVSNLVAGWVERRRTADGKERSLDEMRKIVEDELKVDYLVTGSWSLKASQEAARLIGPEYVNVAVDAREANNGKFGKVPDEKDWKLSKNAAMVYYCDNETVDGVEFPGFPKVLEGEDKIVVADMSSNILSRRIPVEKFSVIFFGAQKNLGTTGITVVIIKKSLLPPQSPQPDASLLRKLGLPVQPVVFDYGTIAKNNSLYNTLSIFDVYIAGQVLKNLRQRFPEGIEGQQKEADTKAAIIYAPLDSYPNVYKVVPDTSSRSRMNVCFRVIKGGDLERAERAFLAGALKRGLQGLKGHRSVGGIRASNYNSISIEGADKLAAYLHLFAEAEDSVV